MKCIIIANGNFDKNTINKYNNYIICADGGIRHTYKNNIHVDLIIGDLDSAPIHMVEYYKNINTKIIKYPKEKDKSDTQICIEYAIDNGFDYITILGALGTRYDHSISNIQNLLIALKRGVFAEIIDNNNRIMLIDKEIKLDDVLDNTISLLPQTHVVKNINTKGLYYEIDNKDMFFGESLGISNICTKNKIYISIEEGLLLLILSKD